MPMPSPRRSRRPGNVVPIVAILAVFLVGMVAFAIDTGYVAGTRTPLQRATDADVRILRYNPAAPAGLRASTTYSVLNPPNCVEVTMRRDDLANGKLPLFF